MRLLVLALLLTLAATARAAESECSDTPGWANGCVAVSHGVCKPSQFPNISNASGYWKPTGSEAGWTCLMYSSNRTGWCKDGRLTRPSAGGARYNYPSRNCCACGKGAPSPAPCPAGKTPCADHPNRCCGPLPPLPPPPPPSASVGGGLLCGGACSSGMVLDRANATVWGVGAKPAATVAVSLTGSASNSNWKATVAADGAWAVSLGPHPPGPGHTLSFNCSDGSSAQLTDVAFGDVILCSGQSNMEYPLSGIVNSSAVMAEAPSFANIRVLRADHLSIGTPQSTLRWGRKWDGSGDGCMDRCGAPLWSKMIPALSSFSAVCFLTGRDLYKALDGKVPIGLVESAWGGTRIEAWTSPDGLAKCSGEGTAKCGPCCQQKGDPWCTKTDPAGMPYCERMNSTNSGNLCSADYNGMLAPILPMRFTAMLWYQGESNTDSFQGTLAGPANYACRMRAAVEDWRSKFQSPLLPFFNVELAACNNYPDPKDNALTWAPIRQASRSFLSLPGVTGFITAIDLGRAGGAVHSNVKQPDGHRMALQLLRKVYNRTDVLADGPTLAAAGPSISSQKKTVSLPFRDAAGLHLAPVSAATDGCAQSPFELGWKNGSWSRASPTIAGHTVELAIGQSPGQDPTEVRYAWHGFPQCVLYSGSGGFANTTALPAAPFRVALRACAQGQTRCSLGSVSIGAYEAAAQCCSASEACVPYGGCQAAVPA